MIAIACHNPHVTQWVREAAPGLFLPGAAPEEAKCYDFFEDNELQGSSEDIRRKAEQGNAAAQAALGTEYFWGRSGAHGNVVGRDYTQAEKWLRRAADQGKTKAQSLLALLYSEGGAGVPQNWTEADFWVELAMQHERQQPENKGLPSCASSVLHKDAESHLNAAQQAAVMQRVLKWKPVVTPQAAPSTAKQAPPPAAAAAPAVQPAIAVTAEAGPCAGFAAGSEDRLVCEDQQKKIQRLKASQAARDKVYRHPGTKPGEASDGKDTDDGKAADAGKETKGSE